jgi:hypothetical protein
MINASLFLKEVTTMKKLLLLPTMALGLLLMHGTGFAGPKVDLCHCPPGHNGSHCVNLNIGESAANNGHLANHPYDHLGACSSDELVGSDEEENFTEPASSGSNWREK